MRHAYPEGDGEVHITAPVRLGKLLVVVTDDGTGIAPHHNSPGRGFGLALIAANTDGCTLVRSPAGGVQLEMRFDLQGARAQQSA